VLTHRLPATNRSLERRPPGCTKLDEFKACPSCSIDLVGDIKYYPGFLGDLGLAGFVHLLLRWHGSGLIKSRTSINELKATKYLRDSLVEGVSLPGSPDRAQIDADVMSGRLTLNFDCRLVLADIVLFEVANLAFNTKDIRSLL